MKNLLIKSVFLMALLGTACSNQDDCCTIVDTNVAIHYTDTAGHSLINSTADWDESNIKIYFKDGDEFDYVIQGNLDHPNFHNVYQDQDSNEILVVFTSDRYVDDLSTTLIEIGQQVSDTLVCQFDLGSNRTVVEKAWLNGEELSPERFITTIR